MEETGNIGENHRPVASHWQTLSHNVVSSTPWLSEFELTLVVICTGCIGHHKSNYHTITNTTASIQVVYQLSMYLRLSHDFHWLCKWTGLCYCGYWYLYCLTLLFKFLFLILVLKLCKTHFFHSSYAWPISFAHIMHKSYFTQVICDILFSLMLCMTYGYVLHSCYAWHTGMSYTHIMHKLHILN